MLNETHLNSERNLFPFLGDQSSIIVIVSVTIATFALSRYLGAGYIFHIQEMK